ncbi:hypothetical protein PR048_018341, partial [Dryococelus australis]
MEKWASSIFYTMYLRIKKDEAKCFNFARMSRASFDELLDIVRCNLTRHDTTMRSAVTPKEKLICTLSEDTSGSSSARELVVSFELGSAVVEWLEHLPPTEVIRARFPDGSSGISHVKVVHRRYRWSAVIIGLALVPDKYLATGCSMTDLHYSFALGRSTVGGIVKYVCQEIWSSMKEMCIPQLTQENWLNVAAGFDSRANFHNCLGAIDGKYIRAIQPKQSGSLNFNYKKFFSIVLLAVCDADFTFTYIDIGSYGRTNDYFISKQTPLYKRMITVPVIAPFVLVGDEAFGLSENVLRPYGGDNLSDKKKIFNYLLSRARRYIECIFRMLANKWRILHRPMHVGIELAVDIVTACCILHNFMATSPRIQLQLQTFKFLIETPRVGEIIGHWQFETFSQITSLARRENCSGNIYDTRGPRQTSQVCSGKEYEPVIRSPTLISSPPGSFVRGLKCQRYSTAWAGLDSQRSAGPGMTECIPGGEYAFTSSTRATGFVEADDLGAATALEIVPDHVADRWVFSGISRFSHPFIPALLHTHLASPSSDLKTSIRQNNCGVCSDKCIAFSADCGAGRAIVLHVLISALHEVLFVEQADQLRMRQSIVVHAVISALHAVLIVEQAVYCGACSDKCNACDADCGAGGAIMYAVISVLHAVLIVEQADVLLAVVHVVQIVTNVVLIVVYVVLVVVHVVVIVVLVELIVEQEVLMALIV